MYIPQFVTNRINASLKELTVLDLIELTKLPVNQNEYGNYEALKRIVLESSLPIQAWTVQEQYAALLHYYYYVTNAGKDFVIDDATNAVLSDYVLKDQDYPIKQSRGGVVSVVEFEYQFSLKSDDGEVDYLKVVPITGAMMAAVERCVLNGHVGSKTDVAEAWRVALAAAMIHDATAEINWLESSDVSMDAFVNENIKRLVALPYSQYRALMMEFEKGIEALDHIVKIRAFNDGFALMPITENKGGEALLPYRFCFDAIAPFGSLEVWQEPMESIGSDAN